MSRIYVAAITLLLSCSSGAPPEVITPVAEEVEALDGGEVVSDPEPVVEAEVELGEVEVVVPVETISVAEMVSQRPAHRDPRYTSRCRGMSRSHAPVAETVGDKDQARARAVADARAGLLNEALLFARVVHGETGAPSRQNDDPATPLWDEAEAILAVIDSRRGEAGRVEMLARYSPRRVFPHPEDERQKWIAELQADGRRPPSWPRPRGRRHHEHPTWESYGCPRWLATLDAVQRVLSAYERRSVGAGPCEQEPDHWGGEMDTYGETLGWRRVSCGVTRNLFWVVPGRG